MEFSTQMKSYTCKDVTFGPEFLGRINFVII